MTAHTIHRPNGGDLLPPGGSYQSLDGMAVLVRHVVEPELSEDEAKYVALMMRSQPEAGARQVGVDGFIDALERALARFDAGERPDLHGHLPADRMGCFCGRVRG